MKMLEHVDFRQQQTGNVQASTEKENVKSTYNRSGFTYTFRISI